MKMKQLFSNYMGKRIEKIKNNSFLKVANKIFINLSLLMFLVCILYYFYLELKMNGWLRVRFVSFFVSFLMSSWVFNNFKYSDYRIIKWLQKSVIFSMGFIILNIISIILCSYLGINIFIVYANSDDDTDDDDNNKDEKINTDKNKDKGNDKDVLNLSVEKDQNTNKEFYSGRVDKNVADNIVDFIKR